MILNGVEVSILSTMKLVDAYNNIFPEDFLMENVIYCIHNDTNGKNYIGQTVKVKNRFSKTYVGHFRDYDKYVSGEISETRALYRAWKKYGLESFTVFIIDTGNSRDELNEKEVYWIKTLHTCTQDPNCFGYNLTWGADDISVNCRESIERSLETRRKLYGEAFANCHTPEAFAKGNKTKEERYGHSGFVNVFTPEANEKRRQTNTEKFGSALGTLKQIWENNIKKYGNKLGPANIPENRKKGDWRRRITLCFNNIFKIISKSPTLVEDWESYKKHIHLIFTKNDLRKNGRSVKGHIKILAELLPVLRLDKRWTPQLEKIFSNFSEED